MPAALLVLTVLVTGLGLGACGTTSTDDDAGDADNGDTPGDADNGDTPGDTDALSDTDAADCGNGIVEGDEECDDGNDVAGDGCFLCHNSAAAMCTTSADCPSSQLCAGTACTCVVQLFGNSYIRSDGTVVTQGLSAGTTLETADGDVIDDAVQGAAYYQHSCVLRSDGTVWCWGQSANDHNRNGELGDGTVGSSRGLRVAGPVLVAADTPLTGIARLDPGVGACQSFSTLCAVATDGAVWCWGKDGAGTLRNGPNADSNFATRIYSNSTTPIVGVDAVAHDAGDDGCVLVGGTVSCWGFNTSGVLGTGDALPRDYPTPVAGLPTDVVAIGMGLHHTCALTNGQVYCWGADGSAGAGPDEVDDNCFGCQYDPVLVRTETGPLEDVEELMVGFSASCAVRSDGAVFCWGGDPPTLRDTNQYYAVEIQLDSGSGMFTQLCSNNSLPSNLLRLNEAGQIARDNLDPFDPRCDGL